jgi:hypothetical protein
MISILQCNLHTKILEMSLSALFCLAVYKHFNTEPYRRMLKTLESWRYYTIWTKLQIYSQSHAFANHTRVYYIFVSIAKGSWAREEQKTQVWFSLWVSPQYSKPYQILKFSKFWEVFSSCTLVASEPSKTFVWARFSCSQVGFLINSKCGWPHLCLSLELSRTSHWKLDKTSKTCSPEVF